MPERSFRVNAIRMLRERKKLTQAELAAKIGVMQSTVARYESGERLPSVFVALKIAEILDCTIDDLLRPE